MDKLIFTYLILFANFITNFAFIPLVFEVIQQKFTNNIPYLTIALLICAQLIFLFVVIYKGYYFHVFMYVTGLICSCILLFLKKYYDKKNTKIIKVIQDDVYMEEE